MTGGDICSAVLLTTISAFCEDEVRAPRSPAVIDTSEYKGTAQASVTAATIPTPTTRSSPHVLRNLTRANIIVGGNSVLPLLAGSFFAERDINNLFLLRFFRYWRRASQLFGTIAPGYT